MAKASSPKQQAAKAKFLAMIAAKKGKGKKPVKPTGKDSGVKASMQDTLAKLAAMKKKGK